MKIVLVGYMGSGKTTIGKLLANKLKISFLDLDEVVEQGLEDSISNIFNGKGEIFLGKKNMNILLMFCPKKRN